MFSPKTHSVNELRYDRRLSMGWDYQPMGYTGESMSVLADLGLEGVLDETTMWSWSVTLDSRSIP